MAPSLAAATPCLTTCAKAAEYGIWWSEGQNSSRSSGFAAKAAMAMAAAVLRATGSSKTVPGTLAACMASDTRKRWSSDATQITRWLSSATRSSVSCSRLLPSMSGTNCLGNSLRLSGQSRVPEPPHRTTGVIGVGGKLKVRPQKNLDGPCFEMRCYWRNS